MVTIARRVVLHQPIDDDDTPPEMRGDAVTQRARNILVGIEPLATSDLFDANGRFVMPATESNRGVWKAFSRVSDVESMIAMMLLLCIVART